MNPDVRQCLDHFSLCSEIVANIRLSGSKLFPTVSRFAQKASFFFVIACALNVVPSARSQDEGVSWYSYYPTTIFFLGKGFSPNDLTRSKQSAVKFDPDESGGSLGTQFQTYLVHNSDELKSSLDVDTKIDAHYLTFQGNAAFGLKQTQAQSSNTIILVIKAWTEFPNLTIRNEVLRDSAKADLAESQKFANEFGSYFIDIVRRGASVSAIVTISQIDDDTMNDIKAGMGASGGWGPFSGSVSATVNTELQRATSANRVDVQVVATGGNGFGELGGVISALTGKTDAISNIESALGNYLKQFTKDNSAAFGFHARSMTTFGWNPNNVNLWSAEKDRILENTVARYRDILSQVSAGEDVVAGNSLYSKVMTQADIAKINQALPAYEKYLSDLAAFWQSVQDGTNKDPAVPTGALPFEPLVDSNRWPPASGFLRVNDVSQNSGYATPNVSRSIIYNADPSTALIFDRIARLNRRFSFWNRTAFVDFMLKGALDHAEWLVGGRVFGVIPFGGYAGPVSLQHYYWRGDNTWQPVGLIGPTTRLRTNPLDAIREAIMQNTFSPPFDVTLRVHDVLGRVTNFPIGHFKTVNNPTSSLTWEYAYY